MAKEKTTVTERHWDETMSDNADMNHYGTCKNCMFRKKIVVSGTEYGHDHGTCQMYESPDHKPPWLYDNLEPCEYYEKEKTTRK